MNSGRPARHRATTGFEWWLGGWRCNVAAVALDLSGESDATKKLYGLDKPETEEFGYKSVEDVVSVHDFHATLLHTLGIDHHALNFPQEGRSASLADAEVTGARIVPSLLA